MQCDPYEDDCHHEDAPQPPSPIPTNPGGGNNPNDPNPNGLPGPLNELNKASDFEFDYKPCDRVGIDNRFCSVPAGFLDGLVITLDILALLISTIEVATADAVWIGAIGLSIFFPEAAPGLLAGALQFDAEVSSALGAIENPMGFYSSFFTAGSDWLKGNTYIAEDGFYVGGSTLASIATTAIGLLPAANVDFMASAYILGVDTGGNQVPRSVNVSEQVHDLLVSFFPD